MEHDYEAQLRTENGDVVVELPEDALDAIGVEAGDDVEIGERDGDMWIGPVE